VKSLEERQADRKRRAEESAAAAAEAAEINKPQQPKPAKAPAK